MLKLCPSGYHFLQSYPNGVEGFLKDHPDFNFAGWIASEASESRKQMDEMMSGMGITTLNVIKTYFQEEKELAEKMEKFIPKMSDIMGEKSVARPHYKLQTLNHNDLHMNNVMYR